jgi:Asp-tRNA(Asn)/Glu-tRNA(Gln) amidotransferase A subunit family amidase
MTADESPLSHLRNRLSRDELQPLEAVDAAFQFANSNAAHNVYLSLDRDWTRAEAGSLPSRFSADDRPALYGVPVSLKDCFDLGGFPTTCGSRYYEEANGIAQRDSWLAQKLRSQGAVITGKTHLHQLAYGITGENPDYGDCLQPRHPAWLTGGSSSGAAASVQEGSALAAIGTDTGGSIRVPAAFCGLAGYRASLGLGDWRGAAHLAESFDTMGWIFRDLRDTPLLAHALLNVKVESVSPGHSVRIGSVASEFLHDCEASVMVAFERFKEQLKNIGHSVTSFDSTFWNESFEVFSPIQASEAAVVHAGHFDRFDPPIGERLAWGASIPSAELTRLRQRHEDFRASFDRLFDTFDFVVLPCAPVSSLIAGTDHSTVRSKILRFTTPASLAGTPVVAVPLQGAGAQLIARHGADAALVAFAASLGERFASQFSLNLTESRMLG